MGTFKKESESYYVETVMLDEVVIDAEMSIKIDYLRYMTFNFTYREIKNIDGILETKEDIDTSKLHQISFDCIREYKNDTLTLCDIELTKISKGKYKIIGG